ncbi:MAG TPA: VCBS repeat-containing protein [Terriglobales bacterium]|nr:VCBS repeat-containing protein [Terriglobales bacterium]
MKNFALGLSVATATLALALQSPTAASFDRLTLKTGKQPGPVTIADFNHDGRNDIAVGNTADGTVTIFLNQGDGRFREAPGSPFAAGNNPNDIAAADVNNDGKLDLVIANHQNPYITILLGRGDGTFAPSPASPIDVQVRPHPHAVAVADFNHDGKSDVVVDSWGNDEVKVLLGDGKGGFQMPGVTYKVGKHPYQRHRVADVNGDGNADIVTTGFEAAAVTVLLGDGKGGFKEAAGSPFAAGENPFAEVIADLNHDGRPDLAVANFSGQGTDFSRDAVNILYGDGTGRFRRGATLQTGHAPVMIAAGDVEGRGETDLATANMMGRSVTLLLNHGGRFDRTDVEIGNHPEGIAIARLLEGRASSIVAANLEDDTIVILTMKPRR